MSRYIPSRAAARHVALPGFLVLLAAFVLAAGSTPARAQNPIVVENALPGNPAAEWDVSGAGDSSIQGFATDISVDQGGTIEFKIDTDATSYRIDIYRLGWYGGLGARKVATVLPSATLPQIQPAGIADPATGLLDCGNWAVSASWAVPGTATSGVYIARLVRTDPEDGRASHVLFVVRDDDGGSNVLLQISETTYQAYNTYGGNSFYAGSATTPPAARAHRISFNRPFVTRGGPSEDWVFNADYPMIRWIERNGYDVSYFTDTDSDRRGAEILEHQVFLSVGHDEYWSAGQRANVEAARDAGVDLAFLSGNEVYWKTRWEPSIDGSGTPYRTLVCYKEGTLGENNCGGKCDPLPNVWTGLWRDGCSFSPPADGCRAENALSGNISWDGSTGAIQVPDTYKNHRLWRNTSIASLGVGQTATLSANTLGYEWDYEQYPASYPPGRARQSQTDFNGKRHHLSLYRATSGALVFGAGTVQWSWGLDGTHDRGASSPDARMQQATVNLLAEMGAQPATLQAGLTAVTATGDVTAPVSTIGFPLPGGTVLSGVQVTITGTATDAAGAVAGVEVSVDGGTTWAVAQGAGNWTFAWTPGAAGSATIRTRAVDDLGNLEAPGAGITVIIDPAPISNCPCTIWPPSAVGGFGSDGNSVELGVRFRADVDGAITGIRFYKLAASTGTHVGKLWTNGGSPMGSATFAGESASGWQQVDFGAAIPITAGTTYVASVFMPNGNYAFSDGFFTSSGVDNPPLHALADNVDGRNGVYLYSPTGGFPTDTFNASNYWIDVVFDNNAGPDVTPPVIVGIAPGNGASGVPVTSNITTTFNEAMNPADLSEATFELRDPGSNPVARAVSYNSVSHVVTIDPAAALAYSTTYTVKVLGTVRDAALNPMGADFGWSFTTAAPPPPPPTEGPGGPILVVTDAGDPFGRYLAEILRTEGLNEFTAMDATLVNAGVLAGYDVVLVHDQNLSAGLVADLGTWVNAGGNLIAIRPDPQLAPLLGLTAPAGTLSNGYLLATGAGPSAGIVSQTIQFHGAADLWTASGATVLATLYSDAATPTAHPAVTVRSVGSSGGQAACFSYDLARSVVYTRQGNPAWVGQERDAPENATAAATLRASDMFYGNAPGDPQPDWINLTKVAIPQADEQQRLLANLILSMNLDRKPLPRFWYFPSGKKAVVIMTGDNHGDGGMASRYQIYVNQSPPGCSVDDWECIRASGYMYVGGGFTDAQALSYHNQGFEVGIHVNTNCNNWTEASLRNDYDTQLAGFAAAYPSLPSQNSNRTHCGAWSDWATQARVEAEKGIRLDTNYYYWPGSWIQDRPGMFTGSGMPMRFADLDGTMIDCYQAATQMTDESDQSYPATINSLLDRALGAEGYYGAFCANMHFDSSPHAGSDLIVASALARGVPVVSGRQMMTWLDGRNGSSFGSMSWAGNALSFAVAVGSGARNLRGMVPRLSAVGPLNALTRGGSPVAYTIETIKGVEYAMFPADAGNYVADYSPDTSPPVISNVAAAPLPNGTATITWTTDEAADSRVDYGTAPGSLISNQQSAAPVTSHSVLLSGLLPNTTYYYRVTSADAIPNSSTSPNPPADPLAFTTPPPLCFADDTDADFGAGTTSGTYVSLTGDGEVILAPTVAAEFSGSALPAGFGTFVWNAGGGATVAGGTVTVDGARVNSLGPTFGPGRSLEFVATFGAAPFQAVGMGGGGDLSPGAIYDGPPWVMFSTGAAGTAVMARTDNGSTSNNETLPGALLGTPHRYRIDWNPASVDYYVDGALVTSHAIAVAGPMRPAASDFNAGGAAVTVDWLRMSPYPATGTFSSRVFDGSSSTSWGPVTWASTTPPGTSLGISVRTGNTATPDGSWTAYIPVPSSGSNVGATSRYIQYRADLATSNVAVTPELLDLSVTCGPAGPDLTPPVISNVQATVSSGTQATITWTTDEPADSRVDYGVTPSLGTTASSATPTVSHSVLLAGLLPGTTYHYRVTSADAATNPAESPIAPGTLTFSTPAAVCAADDGDADFAAGSTAGGTYVSRNDDGEVILAPAFASEFEGVGLPAGWTSTPWSGGGTTSVSGGAAVVDGALFGPGTTFGPGSTLEFEAVFGLATFQHVGFSDDFNSAWIIFSTHNVTGTLYARTSAPSDIPLPGVSIGVPHRFRIDWTTGSIVFSVDGAPVATLPGGIATSMRPLVSDFAVGGPAISLSWLRVLPYAPTGTFDSRVHDAGGPVSWVSMSWTASTPAGTTLSMFARGGEDPDTAHPSWSAFQPIAVSGQSVGLCSRYLQYRAVLTSSDPAVTPAVEDVAVTCAPSAALTPIGDLASAASTTPPDASGRIKIALTWSGAGGGGPTKVYRKAYGDYPTYAPGVGMVPTAPVSPAQAEVQGWTLTAVAASGQEDLPPTRDFWYYVAYHTNPCGSASSVSNLTGGTLDYVLGDVSDGSTPCAGDNVVTAADVSLLGFYYGRLTSQPSVPACLDFGPTLGGSPLGRPVPDGAVEFEDLVILALNYTTPPPGPGLVAARRGVPVAAVAAANALALVVPALPALGEGFTVTVRAAGAGDVHAVSLALDYDRAVVEMVKAEPGELLNRQESPSVVMSSGPGRVDVALLGKGVGLCGEGDLVRMQFRVRSAGDAKIVLTQSDARDGANRHLAMNGTPRTQLPIPTVTLLAPARPNPFRETMTIDYALAHSGPVDLAVYGVDGRRVRTLVRDVREPGEYLETWDGRDDRGQGMGAGVYYVRLVTGEGRFVRRVLYLK